MEHREQVSWLVAKLRGDRVKEAEKRWSWDFTWSAIQVDWMKMYIHSASTEVLAELAKTGVRVRPEYDRDLSYLFEYYLQRKQKWEGRLRWMYELFQSSMSVSQIERFWEAHHDRKMTQRLLANLMHSLPRDRWIVLSRAVDPIFFQLLVEAVDSESDAGVKRPRLQAVLSACTTLPLLHLAFSLPCLQEAYEADPLGFVNELCRHLAPRLPLHDEERLEWIHALFSLATCSLWEVYALDFYLAQPVPPHLESLRASLYHELHGSLKARWKESHWHTLHCVAHSLPPELLGLVHSYL
jgi:hypothetical protein